MTNSQAPTEADLDTSDDEADREAGGVDGDDVGATRRAKRRAFRKDEILRTALELVTEGGLDAVTTTELAKRTGAALGALYRFFPSKAAVIAALQQRALEQLSEDLRAAVDDTRARSVDLPPRARALAPIITMADTFFAQQATQPARYRLIDEIMSKPAAVYEDNDAVVAEEAIRPMLLAAFELVTEFAAVSGGVVDDHARRFPIVMWGALHGTTHFIKRDRLMDEAMKSRMVAGTLMRLLLSGLGATGEDIAAAAAVACPQALQL